MPAVLSVWSTDETAVRDACDAREPRGNCKESPAAVLVPFASQYVLWRPALADAKVEEAKEALLRSARSAGDHLGALIAAALTAR